MGVVESGGGVTMKGAIHPFCPLPPSMVSYRVQQVEQRPARVVAQGGQGDGAPVERVGRHGRTGGAAFRWSVRASGGPLDARLVRLLGGDAGARLAR